MKEESYKMITLDREHSVARITFNRPEVHNAFDSVMIAELDDAFEKVTRDKSSRVVVLTGNGSSFCAGADLNWLREIIRYSFEQNMEESLHLAELLHKIYSTPKPTIAMVNGTTIGGGIGFLSACDMAVAAEEAKFGLSEVKIGLVPAAISPYVIRKIGESRAKEYFLTGKRISARKALEIGLVNEVVPKKTLEQKVEELVNLLLTSGPEAIAKCKELIFSVPNMSLDEAKAYTANMIARLRISDEGQEGMAAFLEKRMPKWAKNQKTESRGQKKKDKQE